MKKDKKYLLPLILVVFIGIFLRLYNLPENAGFNWDQERTAFKTIEMWQLKKPLLIGPRVGPAKFFLPPLYYYIVLPFSLFSSFAPIGLYYSSVFIGLMTGLLFYWIGKKMFNQQTGFRAGAIYFLSPLMVYFDRIPWNVNLLIAGFLLIIYSSFNILENLKNKNSRKIKLKKVDFLLLGLGFGLGFQSHMTFVLFLPLLFFIALKVLSLKQKRFVFKLALTFLIIFIFLLPLLIFDFRHDFLNSKMILDFFQSNSQSAPMFSFWQRLGRNFYTSLLLPTQTLLNKNYLYMGLLLGSIFYLYILKKSLFFGFYLFLPILFLSFYKGETPEYYFFYQIPVIILFLSKLLMIRKIKYFLTIILLVFLFTKSYSLVYQVQGHSLFYKQKVVQTILDKAGSKEFKVSYLMPKGENVGFDYLFFLNKKQPVDQSDLEFLISFPYEANKGFQPVGRLGVKEAL